MKIKINPFLFIGALSLGMFVGCGKKEPADIAQIKEQARQTIRQEVAKVVKDPARADKVSLIAEKYIPLFEQVSNDQIAYLKELREVDAATNSTTENYMAVTDAFRQKMKAHLLAFLDIRDELKTELTADEWADLSRVRTKMRAALLAAAGGN